jgi:hypothetical protein
MMTADVKPSRYIEAGSPQRCFLPSCKNLFEATCFRGDDNRYYCSELCANEGIDADFSTVAPLRIHQVK